jgi:hypothetical protein
MEIDSKYTTQLHDVLVRLRSPIQALLIEEDGVGIVVPSHVVILRRKPDMVSTIDLQYFVQYCNSPYVQQTLEYQAKGSSVITMIQIKTLLEHPLPALPSVEKQRKVVQLMEMLEEEQRLLQKLVDLSRQTQKTLQYSIFPISKPY